MCLPPQFPKHNYGHCTGSCVCSHNYLNITTATALTGMFAASNYRNITTAIALTCVFAASNHRNVTMAIALWLLHWLVCFLPTITETFERFTLLPTLQTHYSGDIRVASGIDQVCLLSPASWAFSPRQYLSADNSVLNKSDTTAQAGKRRSSKGRQSHAHHVYGAQWCHTVDCRDGWSWKGDYSDCRGGGWI